MTTHLVQSPCSLDSSISPTPSPWATLNLAIFFYLGFHFTHEPFCPHPNLGDIYINLLYCFFIGDVLRYSSCLCASSILPYTKPINLHRWYFDRVQYDKTLLSTGCAEAFAYSASPIMDPSLTNGLDPLTPYQDHCLRLHRRPNQHHLLE